MDNYTLAVKSRVGLQRDLVILHINLLKERVVKICYSRESPKCHR